MYGQITPDIWQMIMQNRGPTMPAFPSGPVMPAFARGPSSPMPQPMRPAMPGGGAAPMPLLPPPSAQPAQAPQLPVPYQPQASGAPSGYQPQMGPQAGGWQAVAGLLSQIMPKAASGPLGGVAGALTASPADTGEDPALAARVKGAGYDPLSSISTQSAMAGAGGAQQAAAQQDYGGPDEAQRGAAPRGKKAPAPKAKSVPMPPPRPAGLLSQQDPTMLQRLISGQWGGGPIDQSMVLPGDRTSSRK